MQCKNFIPATIYALGRQYVPQVPAYIYIYTIYVATPHTICISYKATQWGGASNETAKAEPSCYSRCDMIKIPFCSKVIGVEHKPKFYRFSSVMVTSSHMNAIFSTWFLIIYNQQIQPTPAFFIFIDIVCHRASIVYLNNN